MKSQMELKPHPQHQDRSACPTLSTYLYPSRPAQHHTCIHHVQLSIIPVSITGHEHQDRLTSITSSSASGPNHLHHVLSAASGPTHLHHVLLSIRTDQVLEEHLRTDSPPSRPAQHQDRSSPPSRPARPERSISTDSPPSLQHQDRLTSITSITS